MTELSEVYTFKVGEKEIEIVMYAGLLRKLLAASKLLAEPDAFLTDMNVQEEFIELLLTEFDEKGKAIGKKAESFNLPVSVSEDLLEWGYEHCLNFTLNTSEKLKNLTDQKMKGLLEKGSQPTVAG